MTAFISTLILLALTIYGLQRNHLRQAKPHVAGSVDVEDRDDIRVRAELRAIAGSPHVHSRPVARVS